jgi:hypothetical protein
LRFWRPPCYRYTSPPGGPMLRGLAADPAYRGKAADQLRYRLRPLGTARVGCVLHRGCITHNGRLRRQRCSYHKAAATTTHLRSSFRRPAGKLIAEGVIARHELELPTRSLVDGLPPFTRQAAPLNPHGPWGLNACGFGVSGSWSRRHRRFGDRRVTDAPVPRRPGRRQGSEIVGRLRTVREPRLRARSSP